MDPATAELWRSLGIHVPPTVLRESRENHERSLHGALTAIAFKLDKLTAATELNAQTMAAQYARQDYVDEELAKQRKMLLSQESKVIAAARSSAMAGISAMNDRIDRERKKLELLLSRQEKMGADLRKVQHELAEEDAAEELIHGGDTDVISMKNNADQMQALFDSVAEQADAAERKMMEMMDEQSARDAEFESLKDGVASEAREAQERAMRQSKNSADREAKLQAELRRMATEMGDGAEVSKEMEAKMAEQAAAMASADKAAADRMAALQAKLADEQSKMAPEPGAYAKHVSAAEEQRRKEIAAMEDKMREESERLDRERAAAEAKAAEERQRMDAEFAAKLDAVAGQAGDDGEAAAAQAKMMMEQLEQERRFMKERAEAQKAQDRAAQQMLEQQVEMLSNQVETDRAETQGGSPRDDKIGAMAAELQKEKERMLAMQEEAARAEAENEERTAAELARLEEKMSAAAQGGEDGVDSAQVRAEFEKMRKDANLRLQEQQQQQEAERQQMMEDMQRMQQALLAEREKAEAELKDELAASTNAQLASLTDADSARQAGMAATTSAEMEAIQAQIEEEKMRREQEKEAERQRLIEFQQQMKADIDAGATSHPPGHRLNSPRADCLARTLFPFAGKSLDAQTTPTPLLTVRLALMPPGRTDWIERLTMCRPLSRVVVLCAALPLLPTPKAEVCPSSPAQAFRLASPHRLWRLRSRLFAPHGPSPIAERRQEALASRHRFERQVSRATEARPAGPDRGAARASGRAHAQDGPAWEPAHRAAGQHGRLHPLRQPEAARPGGEQGDQDHADGPRAEADGHGRRRWRVHEQRAAVDGRLHRRPRGQGGGALRDAGRPLAGDGRDGQG